ncbi:MAG: hypothetical protein KGI49_00650 [Patescibacteria group bacterium]|nr:hypothetical protein [Patescibacteria group bacterium]
MSWFNHIIVSIGAFVSLLLGNHGAVSNVDVIATSSQQVQSTASSTNPNQSAIDKYNQAMAQRKAEEQSNPPQGFLVPARLPSGYTLTQSRFTSYSTFWLYHAKIASSFGPQDVVLGYDETTKDTFDHYLKTEGNNTSSVEITRDVKDFTWNGSKGAVLGTFVNEKSFEINPLQAGEYWLIYDHQGRLVRIHRAGDPKLTPDAMISLLEQMTIAK